MAPARLILGTIAIATTLMVPGLGRAQTCTSGADCAKGLSCQVDGNVATSAVPCLASDGGTECAPVVTPTTTTMSCQAAACATAADCGTNMVCHSQTSTTCTGDTPVAVKCDPTTGCDAASVSVPQSVVCTDTFTSTCTYTWELPCNANADCGDGFTCQPTTYGMCSGGSGTATGSTGTSSSGSGVGGGSGSAGAPTPVPPPDVDAGVATTPVCTTVSSYPGSCVANPVSCTTSAECPSGWTCALVSTGTASAGAPSTGPGVPVAIDAGVVALPPPPVVTTTTGTCQPPSTHGTRGTTEGSDTTKTAGAPVPTSGDAGTYNGSTTPPSPTVPSTPSANNGPGTTQTAASTSGGGGCNVGAGVASGPWGFWAGLGLLGMLARRRRS